MCKRAKEYSFRDVERILKDNGYSLDRKRGDHFIYKAENKGTISVPIRPNRMVIKRIIKENNLIESE